MHSFYQMEIIHHICFLTLFACIVISTFTLCFHIARNFTMTAAWIILLCLHSPGVYIVMHLMIDIPKEGKLNLLSFHGVKHTGTLFLMICH